MPFAIALSIPMSARVGLATRTALRCVMAWLVGVALWCGMAAASAQVVLESLDNTVLAGSGPTGDGPSASQQVVTLRHNTDNPAGDTMMARTPAITVTYSLINQQFTGLTAAESFPASTGGNAVFFGGAVTLTGNAPAPGPIYGSLMSSSNTTDMYSSAAAPAGQGISDQNGGVRLTLGTNAIAVRSPSTPTTARVRMADLVIAFSVPVDNPILHFNSLGARASAPGLPGGGSAVPLGLTGEFNVLTPGVTLTRLSGSSAFSLSGNQINNVSARIDASCADGGGGACGSVRVNGTAISSLTLRVFVRGDGYAAGWWELPGSFNGDGLRIGVSLVEPTPTVTVRKVSTGGVGTFNFTGTNGYTATSVTTATSGTARAGTTRTLSAANTATTITEAATAGYRLSNISCTGLGSGGTATPTYTNNATTAGSVLLNAAATALGSTIECTFTNQRIPVIRLQKALPNGRAVAGDQFTLSMTGTGAPSAVTTDGTGSTATGSVTHSTPTIGSSYTLSETAAGTPTAVLSNYLTTYSCTNALAGGQTPAGSGTSFSVTPAAGDDLTCTFTNALRPRVTIRKTSVGGTDSFTFSGNNGIANQTIATATSGTPVAGAVQVLTSVGVETTITEGAPPAGFALTDIACTGVPAGSTTVNLATRTVTLNAAATAAGADVTCTFTNTRPTQLTLIKTVTNDNGGTQQPTAWTLSASGPTNISGVTGTSAVTNATVNPGTYTLSESATPTGYTASTYSCVRNGGAAVVSNSITLAAGDTATCTIHNNDRAATLTLIKTVTNDNGGTQLPTAWTLSAAGPTNISGVTGTSAVTNATVNPGTYTLSESATPIGYTASTYSCVRNGGAAVVSNSITLAAGDTATCTIHNNDRAATLTLIKTVTNDNGGTQLPTAWTLSAAGPTNISGATGSAAVTNAAVNAGVYTLSESATPTGYTASTYSCVRNGGAAVVSNSLTLGAGDVATCTIHNNDSNQTDLQIAKTASPDPVRSGSRVQFTLVVTNRGPAAADGAVVRDPAVTGLDCTAAGLPAVSCSATGSAACPASLTASGLQAGVSIPALPNGGVVTIGLTCDVTASGLP